MWYLANKKMMTQFIRDQYYTEAAKLTIENLICHFCSNTR